MTDATRANQHLVSVSWRKPDARHEALRALAEGRPNRALDLLSKEIQEGRETAGHWYALALIHFEAKRLLDASTTIDRAIRLDPGNAGIWLLAGRIAEERRVFREALARWRKAELLRPEWPEPPFNVATRNAEESQFGIDDRPLVRAHCAAPTSWRMFPFDPGRPPIPRRLAERISGTPGGELLRRVLPRWTHDTSLVLISMRLSQLGLGQEAIDLNRVLLVFRPEGRETWMTLANLARDNQRVVLAGSSILRCFVAGGFGKWSTRSLMYTLRRSNETLDCFITYFRENAGRSAMNRYVFRAAERSRLARDKEACQSDAALSQASSVWGRVADARVLREVPISERGMQRFVTLPNAVVCFDLIRLMVVHENDHLVADIDAVSNAAPIVYVRFEDERVQRIEKAFLVGRSYNHFDWLIETSRNLKAYVDGGFDFPFLTMGPVPTRAQKDLFDVLGLRDRARPWLSVNSYVQCASLTVTQDLFKPVGFEPTHLRWLRNVVLGRLSTDARGDRPKRIFVSRRDSNRRRIANEEEISSALAPLGFQTIALGALSLTDQAALFDGADMIVAGKGAGLANLAFCRPGTRIIELSPTRLPEYRHFHEMSEAIGLDYHVCFGERGPVEWGSDREIALRFDVSEIIDVVRSAAG